MNWFSNKDKVWQPPRSSIEFLITNRVCEVNWSAVFTYFIYLTYKLWLIRFISLYGLFHWSNKTNKLVCCYMKERIQQQLICSKIWENFTRKPLNRMKYFVSVGLYATCSQCWAWTRQNRCSELMDWRRCRMTSLCDDHWNDDVITPTLSASLTSCPSRWRE